MACSRRSKTVKDYSICIRLTLVTSIKMLCVMTSSPDAARNHSSPHPPNGMVPTPQPSSPQTRSRFGIKESRRFGVLCHFRKCVSICKTQCFGKRGIKVKSDSGGKSGFECELTSDGALRPEMTGLRRRITFSLTSTCQAASLVSINWEMVSPHKSTHVLQRVFQPKDCGMKRSRLCHQWPGFMPPLSPLVSWCLLFVLRSLQIRSQTLAPSLYNRTFLRLSLTHHMPHTHHPYERNHERLYMSG